MIGQQIHEDSRADHIFSEIEDQIYNKSDCFFLLILGLIQKIGD